MTGKCWFCSDRAVEACEFSITEPRIAYPEELQDGDLVQSTRDLEFHMVTVIKPLPVLDEVVIRYEARRGRVMTDALRRTIPLLVLRTEACGVPVCETHFLDNGRIVCPYHWEVLVQTADETTTASAGVSAKSVF